MYSNGKIPLISWVKQWGEPRGVLQEDSVEDVVVGPSGYYEVILTIRMFWYPFFNFMILWSDYAFQC